MGTGSKRLVVCKAYDVGVERLSVASRGITDDAKNVAIYLTRHLPRGTLDRIGQEINMNKYSTVSTMTRRVK